RTVAVADRSFCSLCRLQPLPDRVVAVPERLAAVPDRFIALANRRLAMADRVITLANRVIPFVERRVACRQSFDAARFPGGDERLRMLSRRRLQLLDLRLERGQARATALDVAGQLGRASTMGRDLVLRPLRRRPQAIELAAALGGRAALLFERGFQRLEGVAQ